MAGINVSTIGNVVVERFGDECVVQTDDMSRADFDKLYDGICIALDCTTLAVRTVDELTVFSRREDDNADI